MVKAYFALGLSLLSHSLAYAKNGAKMNIFCLISLLGGLAMFLYGMKLMSTSLKEHSSGALKVVLEKMAGTTWKAFLLGLLVTAAIQSSTATIVITSGLVAAGLLTLRQSLGIIVGANVGTTVTGQIIRLLDVGTGSGGSSAASWLEIFKPSTLAPVALIIGIILIYAAKKETTKVVGNIAIGFGILFSGLLTMTTSVGVLNDQHVFDSLFLKLDSTPLFGYGVGAGVAFILQSSSASIGILQTFASETGLITFKGIYATLVGIYLGDCVTTAIVCSIGAKADSKRVGIVNIIFNLGKTALVLVVVSLLHAFGVLDGIWNTTMNAGSIADTNTIFNLACSLLLFPFLRLFEKLSIKVIKDDPAVVSKFATEMDALNPVFFGTPALALRSCYNLLNAMIDTARVNIDKAFDLLFEYDEIKAQEIEEDENEIDRMTDALSNYLVQMSKALHEEKHIRIMDEYYKIVTQAERLGDHAMNICEEATDLNKNGDVFSDDARNELRVTQELLDRILELTKQTFMKRDVDAAHMIEPLEEVVDDLVDALRDNHLQRLRNGKCSVVMDNDFLNLLSDIERISDTCSNIGIAVITRACPELENRAHNYVSTLHQGNDEEFNREYGKAHDLYFSKLESETK